MFEAQTTQASRTRLTEIVEAYTNYIYIISEPEQMNIRKRRIYPSEQQTRRALVKERFDRRCLLIDTGRSFIVAGRSSRGPISGTTRHAPKHAETDNNRNTRNNCLFRGLHSNMTPSPTNSCAFNQSRRPMKRYVLVRCRPIPPKQRMLSLYSFRITYPMSHIPVLPSSFLLLKK